MTTEYKEFLPRVMPEVIGCPVPVILQAIGDAVREFCERTWIWQDVVALKVEEGSREGFVFLQKSSRLVAVKCLIDEGRERDVPEGMSIKASSFPIEFGEESTETKEMKAKVVLKPSETSSTFPSWIFNDHAETIAQGAKARLMYDNRKAWGSPELASLNHQLFRKAITKERIKIHQGYTKGRSRVKSRGFV